MVYKIQKKTRGKGKKRGNRKKKEVNLGYRVAILSKIISHHFNLLWFLIFKKIISPFLLEILNSYNKFLLEFLTNNSLKVKFIRLSILLFVVIKCSLQISILPT
jgi:hypothetical protein